MKWQSPEHMDEYLRPTELCDSDSQIIQSKAEGITKDATTPKQGAMFIFDFVRDKITFGMDLFDRKASETLNKGVGFCITKTNLQIALLRAVNIPARYHQAVLTKESIKGIIPSLGYKLTPDRIWWHPWCECYLDEKWIACDTLLDKQLYDAMCGKGIVTKDQVPSIDWDGEHDLNTMTNFMLEDVGTSPNLDDVFRRAQKEAMPPKPITKIFFAISNKYTRKVRMS